MSVFNTKLYVCQNLEVQEFTDIRPFFPPLMHLVCLVYSHSAYYNTAARIIILLQVWKRKKYARPYYP